MQVCACTVDDEHSVNDLQHAEVLESREVRLGDACEVIPIQFPANTHICIMYSVSPSGPFQANDIAMSAN